MRPPTCQRLRRLANEWQEALCIGWRWVAGIGWLHNIKSRPKLISMAVCGADLMILVGSKYLGSLTFDVDINHRVSRRILTTPTQGYCIVVEVLVIFKH